MQLNVLELFLDCITEPNEKLIEFGVGGICNCCVGNSGCFTFHNIVVSTRWIVFLVDKKVQRKIADPVNAAIITGAGGIPLIIQCLSSPVRNTVRIRNCWLSLFHFVMSWLCLNFKLNVDPWAVGQRISNHGYNCLSTLFYSSNSSYILTDPLDCLSTSSLTHFLMYMYMKSVFDCSYEIQSFETCCCIPILIS